MKFDHRLSRRDVVLSLVAGATAPLLTMLRPLPAYASVGGSARLHVSPELPSGAIESGNHDLELDGLRDGSLYVPAGYSAKSPAPLILALHGAGGSGEGPVRLLHEQADARGVVLLAPDSRGGTWDAIRGNFGPDIAFIERALRAVFAKVAIDPQRMFVEGFSDGASYALALALANGDTFRRAVAFSPGFVPPSDSPDAGKPEVFISHGRQDPILPMAQTSARIVPALKRKGLDVKFHEFDGGHQVPPDVSQAALDWLLRS